MALGTVRSCEFPQELSRSFDRCEGFRQSSFLRIVSGVYFVPGFVPGVHSDRCALYRSLLAELNRPRDMAVTQSQDSKLKFTDVHSQDVRYDLICPTSELNIRDTEIAITVIRNRHGGGFAGTVTTFQVCDACC
jgi:hypothetical protein